jgi:hypothetical protein
MAALANHAIAFLILSMVIGYGLQPLTSFFSSALFRLGGKQMWNWLRSDRFQVQ